MKKLKFEFSKHASAQGVDPYTAQVTEQANTSLIKYPVQYEGLPLVNSCRWYTSRCAQSARLARAILGK